MSVQPSDLDEIVKVFPFRNSPSNPGYVYIGVIFECLGQEPPVTDLWDYVTNKFPEQSEQAIVARRLREGLLKASVLVGFPRVRLVQFYLQSSATDLIRDSTVLPLSGMVYRRHHLDCKSS